MRRSPLVVLITFFVLTPMAAYLLVQLVATAMGYSLSIDQDWGITEWVYRVLPWAMIVFAYPFADETEGSVHKKWFATTVLVSLNLALYFAAYGGFEFLTSTGRLFTGIAIALIDLLALLVYLFRRR